MATPATHPVGILPSQSLEKLIAERAIVLAQPVGPKQIQPASMDVRLGVKVYRVRASFLPGPGQTVADRLRDVALHEIDLTHGAVLETGAVYVAELLESLALPEGVLAAANPKSSTGRLDVFTRVITDRATRFDQIDPLYHGPLFLEISPRTFPVLVRTGTALAQIRLRNGEARLGDAELAQVQEREKLVDAAYVSIQNGVAVGVDLSGFGANGLVGYRAKRFTGLVDMDRIAGYDVLDFWETLHNRHGRSELILDPGQFYILASKEAVCVPPDFAAEMTPFDPLVGEFRVHYAGFFDPGFGHASAGASNTRAVLEVRSRDVPFILEDGQIVGRLVYERMAERPRSLYGVAQGSNYQGQSLKLSKHFKTF
jgi:dCTP deaminase